MWSQGNDLYIHPNNMMHIYTISYLLSKYHFDNLLDIIMIHFTDKITLNHPNQIRYNLKQRLTEGLGFDKMQAQDKPLWTHRICLHNHNLPRWITLCIRWQRRHHNAMGPQRRQTPLLARRIQPNQCTLLLSKKILALLRNYHRNQDLGP